MATTGHNILIGTVSGNTFTPMVGVRSHEMQNQCDLIEKASSTQQAYREYRAGRKEWSLNVSVLVLNNAQSNVRDLLKVGETYNVASKDRTDTYRVAGTCICTQCKQSYQEGNLAYGSFAFKGTGALQ